MAVMSPFLKSNRKYMGLHVDPPKLSLWTKFERHPVGVVRVMAASVFKSKMTIPDLGVKFQTI